MFARQSAIACYSEVSSNGRRPALPTFQTFLPSDPSANVDALADIESLVRPARALAKALSFLTSSWRQKIMTVVNDLGGNPKPLKFFWFFVFPCFLVAGDAAFATEINSIYKQTNVQLICSDESFFRTLDVIEIELLAREVWRERTVQANAWKPYLLLLILQFVNAPEECVGFGKGVPCLLGDSSKGTYSVSYQSSRSKKGLLSICELSPQLLALFLLLVELFFCPLCHHIHCCHLSACALGSLSCC